MSIKLTHVETSNPIDLTTWGAFTLKPKLGKKISQLMQYEFDAEPPRLDLPISYACRDKPTDGYRGPPPDDPIMLYVILPLGPNDEGVVYACSLEAVVDDLIDWHEDRTSRKITDADGCEIAAKVAMRLRELADKLNGSCAPGTSQGDGNSEAEA